MQTSRGQPIGQLSRCSWFPFSDEPVLQGMWYAPRLSEPSFLFPEDGPDGKWHMFVHSWMGIHHFMSTSGIVWEPFKLVQLRGRSPCIIKDKGTYYVLYERYGGRVPFIERTKAGRDKIGSRDSRIEMRSSNDLLVWSEPRLLLDGRTVAQASDGLPKPRLSYPRLVSAEGGYRLYFGASKVMLEDSGESTTRYVCSAFAHEIGGPYVMESVGSMLESIPNDAWRNLGCGNLTVLPGLGGYAAVQSGAYWDEKRRSSASALVHLASEDGKSWRLGENCRMLVPAEKGWASRYITSCDIRYKAEEECWYCYFSATGDTASPVRHESIGLLIGKDPSLLKTVRS